MLPPKGTIKNLGHASRGRRPKSAGAIKARTKAAKMAEAQAQAEHRERLRKLLTQKLTAKHGPGKRQAIKANVDQFVKSNTVVSELELKKLDKAVEDKNTIDKVWPSARQEVIKPAAGSAVQVLKQKESLSRSETPELTQEIDRHSKWKVLNAYSALKNEDFEASFVQKEREKKKEYRKILDEQMVIKQSKSQEAELRRQDEDFVRSQKQLLSEWREQMKVQQKETKGRYLDQHKTRQLQAQLKRDRAAKEFDAQRAMEWAQVASNQLTIEANKKAAREAQEAARRKNEEIVRQNILDRAKKAERKKKEGEEDVKLMKLYKEKLRRQELQRKEQFAAVQARLDAFAAKSAGQKGGALYEKQQNDLALELKILREADIKDKADAERDRRDKEEVRIKAKQMQEWNLKSAALKKQRERKEVTDEHHYAEDFIRQSEDFMRAEKEKFDRIRKMRERHNVELLEHVRLHKLAQKHVEMDEKEEKVNRGLLKDIYADDKYRKRLAERLKFGQKFTMKKSEEFKYKSNVL